MKDNSVYSYDLHRKIVLRGAYQLRILDARQGDAGTRYLIPLMITYHCEERGVYVIQHLFICLCYLIH